MEVKQQIEPRIIPIVVCYLFFCLHKEFFNSVINFVIVEQDVQRVQ